MLQIWFDTCRAAGITEILINLHAHADQVREFAAAHAQGLKVVLFEEPELLGSAGTLRANRQWLAGESAFWVLYSDVLTSLNFPKMLAEHRQTGSKATLGVYHVENPSRCGIVSVDAEMRITDFVEKPENPTSNLAFSGVIVGSPEIIDLIPRDKPTPDIGFDLLPLLVGQMHAYPIHEFLLDIGTRETYDRAQTEWPGIS